MNQTDLLAEFETKKRNNLYSKLSIGVFFITATLVAYTFATMSTRLRPQNSNSYIYRQAIAISIIVFCITGIVLSIFSIIKREKPIYLKVIGLTLNALLFLFLVAGIVFANAMDNKKSNSPAQHTLLR